MGSAAIVESKAVKTLGGQQQITLRCDAGRLRRVSIPPHRVRKCRHPAQHLATPGKPRKQPCQERGSSGTNLNRSLAVGEKRPPEKRFMHVTRIIRSDVDVSQRTLARGRKKTAAGGSKRKPWQPSRLREGTSPGARREDRRRSHKRHTNEEEISRERSSTRVQ